MSAFRPETRIQPCGQNVFNHAAHLFLGENRNAFSPNEIRKGKGAMHDLIWHRSLERAGPYECHDVVYLIMLNTEKVLCRFHVQVILKDRILKSLPEPVNHLRPLCLARLAKNPPCHVLGFNHEYSVRRKYQLVNLSGFIADW